MVAPKNSAEPKDFLLTIRENRIIFTSVMNRKRIYPNLRAYLKARRRRGSTQADVAAEFQISAGHLSDLKKGRVKPSLDLAFRMDERGIPIESFK